MENALQNYILPLIMLSLVLLVVSLRIRSLGGPTGVFLRFFAIAFGPSLLYAALADESDPILLGASLALALLVEGVLLAARRRKKSGPSQS